MGKYFLDAWGLYVEMIDQFAATPGLARLNALTDGMQFCPE